MSEHGDAPIDPESGVEERPQNRREWRGALRSLALPALIVATIVGGLYYVERRGDGGGSGGGGVIELAEERNATGRGPSTEVGRAAPDFVLETLDRGELRFSDLQGKPVLVNFWATWCRECREEMPEIVRAYEERGERGEEFVVVAVNLQENAGQVREFAEDFGMEFPVVIDRTGQVAEAWRIGGPVEGLPATFFVDERGVVRSRVFGPLTAKTLAEGLAVILE
jgi:peroxiredoxin